MTELLIVMLLVTVLLLLEVPVGLAFGAAALLYGVIGDTDISFHASYAYSQLTSYSLLALPLFVLSGTLMGTSGISARLLDFIDAFVGRTKSGLGAVTVLTCMIFGAVSGSASAAITAIGRIMVPRMIESGYPPGHATALIGVSSVLALMIPPSVTMIVFAIAIRESVSQVFLATMVPGIILGLVYCVLNYIFLRNVTGVKVRSKLSRRETTARIAVTGKRATLALLMPFIILGGIYSGIATPTEAGSIAFIYTLIVGFVFYRSMTVKDLYITTVDAAKLVGAVMMILFFMFVMSRSMVLARVPMQFADLLLDITENRILLLLLINLLLVLIGMVMDDISGGVLAAIILLPVMERLGVDPIHFAAIVGTNLGMGNITPPCAPLLYMAGGISKVPLSEYFGPSMKFILLGHLPVVLLVTFVPGISMSLPALLSVR